MIWSDSSSVRVMRSPYCRSPVDEENFLSPSNLHLITAPATVVWRQLRPDSAGDRQVLQCWFSPEFIVAALVAGMPVATDFAVSWLLRKPWAADTSHRNVRFKFAISICFDSHSASADSVIRLRNCGCLWNCQLADSGSSRLRNSPATWDARL